MNEAFLTFLSLSLSGSLVALLLLFLKPFIKDRLSGVAEAIYLTIYTNLVIVIKEDLY